MPKLFIPSVSVSWRGALPYVVLALIVGVAVALATFAAGNPVAFEPENGTLSGGATVSVLSGASGGQSVRFSSGAASAPSPTPGSTAATAYARGLAWYKANTGVPSGIVLTASGGLNITIDGTVIENKDITGNINVDAKNVTIRNSRIKGQIFVDHGDATFNTIIDHVEIDLSSVAIDSSGNSNKYGVAAWWGTTVKFSKIHGMAQGIAFSGYLTAEDNYIYGIRSNGQHSECILSNGDSSVGGGNSVIHRNWLDADSIYAEGFVSSAMSMYGDFGQIKNVVVDGNYFTGDGYLLYPGATKQKPYPWPYNVTVTNNTFDTTGYGPVYPSKLDTLSESLWANNQLVTGATVPPPSGNN